MSQRECLIAEVREQRKVLACLMERLAAKEDFDRGDSFAFDAAAKQVEKSLRRISNLLAEDYLKHLSQTWCCG